jgi:hypothetical protein
VTLIPFIFSGRKQKLIETTCHNSRDHRFVKNNGSLSLYVNKNEGQARPTEMRIESTKKLDLSNKTGHHPIWISKASFFWVGDIH